MKLRHRFMFSKPNAIFLSVVFYSTVIVLLPKVLNGAELSIPKKLTLQQVALLHGGIDQWTNIIIVRGGKLLVIGEKEFQSHLESFVLDPDDIITFNEAADWLQEWHKIHTSDVVSLAKIAEIPHGVVTHSDGTPFKLTSDRNNNQRKLIESNKLQQHKINYSESSLNNNTHLRASSSAESNFERLLQGDLGKMLPLKSWPLVAALILIILWLLLKNKTPFI